MDIGHRSDQELTREAVVELAHAVGRLSATAISIQGAVAAIERALRAQPSHDPAYGEALSELRLHVSVGQDDTRAVYENIVAILTRLGAPNG